VHTDSPNGLQAQQLFPAGPHGNILSVAGILERPHLFSNPIPAAGTGSSTEPSQEEKTENEIVVLRDVYWYAETKWTTNAEIVVFQFDTEIVVLQFPFRVASAGIFQWTRGRRQQNEPPYSNKGEAKRIPRERERAGGRTV
jgi:hypothetical protein